MSIIIINPFPPSPGASVTIRPDSKAMADLEEANHLYVVENFLYKFLFAAHELLNKPPKVLAGETIIPKLEVAAKGKKTVLNTSVSTAKKSGRGAMTNTEEETEEEGEEEEPMAEEISENAVRIASITVLVFTIYQFSSHIATQ